MWKWPWWPDSSFGRTFMVKTKQTEKLSDWLTSRRSYVAPAFTLESDQFLISISSGALRAVLLITNKLNREVRTNQLLFSQNSVSSHLPNSIFLSSVPWFWSTDLIPLLNIAFSVCSLVCFSFHACVVRTNSSFVPLKFTIFPLARSGMARQGAKKRRRSSYLNQTPKKPKQFTLSLPYFFVQIIFEKW